MDSYAAALRRVADERQWHSGSTPQWFESANAAANGDLSPVSPEHALTLPRVPPPKPRAKPTLRSRLSFPKLERVIEEPGREASPSAPSMSGASTSSTSDSVRTAIYRPPSAVDSSRESLAGSGNESGSSSSHPSSAKSTANSMTKESSSDTQATSISNPESPSQPSDNLSAGSHSSTQNSKKLSKLHPGSTAQGTNITAPDAISDDETTRTYEERIEGVSRPPSARTVNEDPAPAPVIPTVTESDGTEPQGGIAANLTSAKRALKAKLKPVQPDHGPTTKHQSESPQADQFETRVDAIDGMLDSLGPPANIGLAITRDSVHLASPRSGRHTIGREDEQTGQRQKRPDAKTHETTRDGVPILMREKSGVWVESVEGANLISAQDQQQNVPKGQPIAEREAEDIPEIRIPEDPWNNLPPYIKLEYGSPNPGHSEQRPTTRAQREQATATWAQDQARLQDDQQPRNHIRHHSGSDPSRPQRRGPGDIAQLQRPPEPVRNKSRNKVRSPYHLEGKTFLDTSDLDNTNNLGRSSPEVRKSSSSSDRATGSRSTPNTSQTTDAPNALPPRSQTRAGAPAAPLTDMQSKIAASAAAVEQMVYGLPPARARGRASRFQGIELI